MPSTRLSSAPEEIKKGRRAYVAQRNDLVTGLVRVDDMVLLQKMGSKLPQDHTPPRLVTSFESPKATVFFYSLAGWGYGETAGRGWIYWLTPERAASVGVASEASEPRLSSADAITTPPDESGRRRIEPTTTVPTPVDIPARDYQTQVYQSLIKLGAGMPGPMMDASGDYWKNCQALGIAPQVTAGMIYSAEKHRHEVARTTINEAREESDFASRFDAAFDALDRKNGMTNYVGLFDLRAALPDVSRADFDAGLHQLRVARRYTVDFAQSQHHRLTPEQRAAGILESTALGPDLLYWVARRDAADEAHESPTMLGEEWEVIVRRHGASMNKIVEAAGKKADSVEGANVIFGDFRDDEKAAAFARKITKAGFVAYYGPHRELKIGAEATVASDEGDPSAMEMPRGEGGVQSQIAARMQPPEATPKNEADCVTCIPWIKVSRDPAQHAAIAELAKKFGKIKTPRDIYAIVGDDLNRETQEVFLVIALNVHSRLMCAPYEIARGQRDRVAVGIDNVTDAASDARCAAYCVVHNHPGDSPEPSEADWKLYKDIVKATPPGRVCIDSLVVAPGSIYSCAEKKLYKVK